ncbi:MAG: hypothetical protein VXZ97_05865 [Pseudomonadota bacterium]|nr:hypothetical protein [Pseudomonadota bacterium]
MNLYSDNLTIQLEAFILQNFDVNKSFEDKFIDIDTDQIMIVKNFDKLFVNQIPILSSQLDRNDYETLLIRQFTIDFGNEEDSFYYLIDNPKINIFIKLYKDENLYVHTIGLIDYKINNKETDYSDVGSLSDTAQTLSSNPEITRLDINAFDGNLIKNKESFLNLPLQLSSKFIIDERRQVNTGEVYYFDHPYFGIRIFLSKSVN